MPHWIDTVYDDYQKYCAYVNKPEVLVRNLEGEKGYIHPLNMGSQSDE